MKLTVPKSIIKFVGNLYLHKYPFYIQYKPNHHKVKGFEVRQILDVLKPGDILFRRYDGYVSTKFIPGFWSHSGLYIGNDKVAHSISAGVIIEDILDFCRTDSVGVYRTNLGIKKINKSFTIINKMVKNHVKYDYEFKSDNGTVYCTEMVNIAYQNLFEGDYKNVAGNKILTPDGLAESKLLQEIIVIRH